MFQQLDEDGGGTLDIQEITAMFRDNQIKFSEAEVAELFQRA